MGILEDLLEPDTADPPAAPAAIFTCPTCSSARGWLDVYGNPAHCYACFAWPSPSLVAELVGDWPVDVIERVKVKATKADGSKKEAAPPTTLDESASPGRPASGEGWGEESEADRQQAREAAAIARALDLADRWDDWRARHGLRRRNTFLVAISEPA